jgi:hypothetical protein
MLVDARPHGVQRRGQLGDVEARPVVGERLSTSPPKLSQGGTQVVHNAVPSLCPTPGRADDHEDRACFLIWLVSSVTWL